MEALPKVILSIHGLIWFSVVVILILLIVRRVKIRKKEDFEKREN
jgi:uncharacterized membrane protein